MSRLFGGLICVAIGIGIAAFAFYTAQNMERPTRWVGRIGWAGVCTVVLGFRIAFGWYKRD
ncbi:MAG TPA: hypothetical protein VHC22_22340 [Pirellulales bacterium]|nr:hypothetical protein [Pirellulales bacterium]